MFELVDTPPNGMIKHINIDPNGVCNAKCWFCPVAYHGNPKDNRGIMSLDTMEQILKEIDAGRGDFVDPTIQIYNNPIHYNEMLMYPYFEEMLELHRKYNIKMYVFSNGTNLTPEKTDLIKKYKDVATDILLNVPSLEQDQWARFTGFNPKIFPKLLNNLKYANDTLYPEFSGVQLMLFVNGISPKAKVENGGVLEVLENAPFYDETEHQRIVDKIKEELSNFEVILKDNMSDRTGILSELNIVSNEKYTKARQQGNVIGCGLKYPDEEFFISATGNVYLCAADFNYETTYDNIKDKSIKDIWNSQKRKEAIEKAYSGVCRDCYRAVWDEGDKPLLERTVKRRLL